MIKGKIKEIIQEVTRELYKEKIPDFVVEWPKQKEHGDYSSNVAMVLAGKLKRNPMDIAEEITEKIKITEKYEDVIGETTTASPGFINFRIADKCLNRNLGEVLGRKEKYGSSEKGKGKTVIVDYSAPNIAKPMHVGHLRSTIIGQSLSNVYKFLGYKVVGDNHIGDWGTQFGKLIYAYKHWGDRKKINMNPIEEMTGLYVKFHKEAESRSDLEGLAREETRKLQAKDDENIKIWRFLVRESRKEFKKVYKILGIKFDMELGESFYDDMLKDIAKESIEKKVASKSDGALIINLDKYNFPPFLIRKTDGAYLYTTTDLAAIKYRKEKFNANKILYVVSNEQTLHFQQLFSSARLFDWGKNIELEHIKFGMVLGENGKKFSTRKGDVVRLEELIKKSIEMANKIIEEKNPKLNRIEKKKIAKTVGLGAIKYNDLSQNRLTDITFNWGKMLSFDGNSAPYLQYTYARINSLIEKFNNLYKLDRLNILDKPDFSLLKEDSERAVAVKIMKFQEAVENSAEENSPHLIALYLFELASLYNNFYNSVNILKSDKKVAKSRIAFSRAVAITIKNGLNLLGIDVLEKM